MSPRGQCAGPPGAVVASCVRDVVGAGHFPAMGELAEEEEHHRRGRTWSVVEGEVRAGVAVAAAAAPHTVLVLFRLLIRTIVTW